MVTGFGSDWATRVKGDMHELKIDSIRITVNWDTVSVTREARILVLILLIAGQTYGTDLSCTADGAVELVVNKTDNRVNCSGVGGAGQTVSWSVEYPNIPGTDPSTVGNCAANAGNSCIGQPLIGFTPSRPSANVSVMTVDATKVLNYMIGNVLVCTAKNRAACDLDKIYRSQVSSCSVQFVTPSNSGWSVTGRCDVTKTYSLLNRYTCQWYQQKGTSAEVKLGGLVRMTTTPTTGDDVSGTCNVTASFPTGDGQYSYRVVVSPGSVSQPAVFSGTNVVRQPSPSHDCPEYVTDGQSVSCTCGGDVGGPPGVAQWQSTQSSQLTVNSSMAGQRQTCHVIYNNSPASPVYYTVKRAYGPSDVTITGLSPFDTNGSKNMVLTCSIPEGSNPASTFTWRRPPGSQVRDRDQSYTFQPQLSEDGTQVSCEARNTFSHVTDSDTFTVNLNYPPTSNPVITDNSTDGHLYQGDTLTLTCSVTGGKPFSATSVTFTCPGKQDGQDNVGSSGVSSSVVFDSLSGNDHDKQCTCITRWKQTNWYSRNVNTRLHINTPPSSPVISPPSTDYPFIATVTQGATLTCLSSTPGRPAANYSWPIKQGGRGATDARGRGVLIFDTVNKDLDGKTVSCRARNRYTDNRHSVEDGTLTLEVYYRPEVRLDPVTGTNTNQCDTMDSEPSHCIVTEGQRVRFRCSASSKPAPASIRWQGRGNGPDLYIESTNRTQHTGTYNCTVETGSNGSDSRLPLRGWNAITVLVKYPTSVLSLSLNSVETTDLEVNVSDTVTLTCRADGRPTPKMDLTRPSGDVIASVSQGTPSLADEIKEVTGDITVQCRDTGVYSCDVNNGVGSIQRHVTIFVQCISQSDDTNTDDETPVANFRTEAVHLIFDVIAYPTPRLLEVSRLPPNASSVGQRAKPNMVSVTCTPESAVSPNVRCNLTVDNVESTDAGVYRALLGNGFGVLPFDFEIKVNATATDISGPVPDPAPIIAGAVAAVVVAVGVIAVAVIVRRWRSASRSKENTTLQDRRESREEDDTEMITNIIYGTSGNSKNAPQTPSDPVPESSAYEEVELAGAKPVIKPKPQPVPAAASASDMSDVYVTVVKERKSQPAVGPSNDENTNVYSTVDKGKKKPVASSSAKPGLPEENEPKPGVKPMPVKKPKPEKMKDKRKWKKDKKGDKKPLQNEEESSTGAVYSNMTTLSMSPTLARGSVYENYAFQTENNDDKDIGTGAGLKGGGCRAVNSEGLVYTTIAFSDRQLQKSEQPPPERETTEYVDIDFTRQVPPSSD